MIKTLCQYWEPFRSRSHLTAIFSYSTFYPWLNGWAYHNMFVSFQFGTHNCTVLIQGLILFSERQHVLNSMFLKYSYLREQLDSSLTRSQLKEWVSNQHNYTYTQTHSSEWEWLVWQYVIMGAWPTICSSWLCMLTHWLFSYTNTLTARNSVCVSKPSAAGNALKLNSLTLWWPKYREKVRMVLF